MFFFRCHVLKHRAHWHLRLGLLSLRNCEQGMLFRPPSLWHLLQQPEQTKAPGYTSPGEA